MMPAAPTPGARNSLSRPGELAILVALLINSAVCLWAQQPSAPPPPIAALAKSAVEAADAGRLEEAAKLFRQAVTKVPKWAEGWWYLGTLAYDQDQFPACRDAFRRFVGLMPKAGPGHAFLGLCQYQLGALDQALVHLERALSLGMPDQPITNLVQYHAGILQTRAGNFERAFVHFSILAQKNAVTPELILAFGIAGLRQPLLPADLPVERRALAIKLGRALLTAAERRPAEAQQQFEEVLAEYPAEPNLHYAFGAFLLAHNPDMAVEELKKELERDPRHLPALVSLTFEYLKRGQPAEARPFAEQAVKVAPGNFTARAGMGRVYLDAGEVNPAIAELELAAKLAPDSPQVRFYLASAYSRAGRKQDAARERAEFARLKNLTSSSTEPGVRP